MGQRLNIEILNKGERLANAYYHWSAYTTSASELTMKIINQFEEIMSMNCSDTAKAILLLQTTGAGLEFCENNNELEYAKENLKDNKETFKLFKTQSDRNEGLICINPKEMDNTERWEEGRVTINIETKTIDLDVIWVSDKEGWKDEEYTDEDYEKLIEFPLAHTWGITFEEFKELDLFFLGAYDKGIWYFKYKDEQVISMIG